MEASQKKKLTHSELLQERRKNKRKKRKRAVAQRPAVDHQQNTDEAQTQKKLKTTQSTLEKYEMIVEDTLIARNPKSGSLSDLLNPGHPAYNESLKTTWKTIPKALRALYVKRDTEIRKASLERVSKIRHPFQVEDDDHCESPAEAYQDLYPVLSFVAEKLGKSAAGLSIYDPYFCAGTCVEHLKSIGFPNVYNKCEDFYKVQEEQQVPEHDVLVTNPPYSFDHVEKLLKFAFGQNQSRPFMLLMPNYVATKSYFQEHMEKHGNSTCFLFPWKRYNYWTPKGLRAKEKLQNHVSRFGVRTSPFLSFWYINLGSLPTTKREMIEYAKTAQSLRKGATGFSEAVESIPSALQK